MLRFWIRQKSVETRLRLSSKTQHSPETKQAAHGISLQIISKSQLVAALPLDWPRI